MNKIFIILELYGDNIIGSFPTLSIFIAIFFMLLSLNKASLDRLGMRLIYFAFNAKKFTLYGLKLRFKSQKLYFKQNSTYFALLVCYYSNN